MPLALYPLSRSHLTFNVAKTNLQINAKGHKSKGNIISSRGYSWETLPFAKFAHYLSDCLFVDNFLIFVFLSFLLAKIIGFSMFVFVFCRFSYFVGFRSIVAIRYFVGFQKLHAFRSSWFYDFGEFLAFSRFVGFWINVAFRYFVGLRCIFGLSLICRFC